MKRGDIIGSVFFLVLFVAVMVVCFIMVRPFLTALLAGALLAYIAYPVYRRLHERIGSKSLSALLVSVLIIFLVSIPSFLVLTHLTQQAQTLYLKTKEHFDNGIYAQECFEDDVVCGLITQAKDFFESDLAREYVGDLAQKAIKFLTSKIADVVLNLPRMLLMVVLAVFTMYYLLRDGKDLFYRITDASPLKPDHRRLLVKNFSEMTSAVVFGSLIIALAQGALATIGFWIAGIEGFLWWGIVTAFTGLVPFVGSWFVWFPASLYLAGTGYLTGDTGMFWRAGFLFLYGLLIVSTIDNILKPILVAGKSRVHPLLVFFGVVGGLITFGFIGLLLGPVLLGLLQTLFLIYEREMRR